MAYWAAGKAVEAMSTRDEVVERLAATLYFVRTRIEPPSFEPEAIDRYWKKTDAYGHADHYRKLAREVLDFNQLVAIDPALVDAVEKAREDLTNAHTDYEAIRLQREDCESFQRLRAACVKVGGDADPWKAWRWLVPTAKEALAEAEKSLVAAVIAQLRGKL